MTYSLKKESPMDKCTPLSNEELSLSQRFQKCYPRSFLNKDELFRWNSCPDEVVRGLLARMLEAMPPEEEPSFGRLFMRIRLGTFKTNEDLFRAFAEKYPRPKLEDWCPRDNMKEIILNTISITEKEKDIDLYEVTVAELGFKCSASQDTIFKRALTYGFTLCPLESGPVASLKFQGLNHAGINYMATETIAFRAIQYGKEYTSKVLYRFQGKCLNIISGGPDSSYYPYDRFIFAWPWRNKNP
jgi:hypothetical protein